MLFICKYIYEIKRLCITMLSYQPLANAAADMKALIHRNIYNYHYTK